MMSSLTEQAALVITLCMVRQSTHYTMRNRATYGETMTCAYAETFYCYGDSKLDLQSVRHELYDIFMRKYPELVIVRKTFNQLVLRLLQAKPGPIRRKTGSRAKRLIYHYDYELKVEADTIHRIGN